MFKNRLLNICIFLGVIVGTVAITAIGALILDLVVSSGTQNANVTPAGFPRLSQNLQNELNTAMSPEFPFNFDMTGNPFADASGVNLEAKKPENLPLGKTLPTLAQLPKIVSNTPANNIPLATQIFGNQNQPNVTVMPTPIPTPTPAIDSNALLAERNRRLRQGEDVGDLSLIYSIDDVKPIGVIGSGKQNRIWLYSPSTKKTFSVAKGTRFRDGSIEGITADGVEFRREDGKSLAVRWSKEGYKADEADSPILRVSPKKGVQAKSSDDETEKIVQSRPKSNPDQ